MSRQKGSKNKPKVPAPTETVVAVKWTPKPDMGSIKPPVSETLLCDCNHENKMHYGSPARWCNLCKCQAFRGLK